MAALAEKIFRSAVRRVLFPECEKGSLPSALLFLVATQNFSLSLMTVLKRVAPARGTEKSRSSSLSRPFVFFRSRGRGGQRLKATPTHPPPSPGNARAFFPFIREPGSAGGSHSARTTRHAFSRFLFLFGVVDSQQRAGLIIISQWPERHRTGLAEEEAPLPQRQPSRGGQPRSDPGGIRGKWLLPGEEVRSFIRRKK